MSRARFPKWPSKARPYDSVRDLCKPGLVTVLAAADLDRQRCGQVRYCYDYDTGYCLDAPEWFPAGGMDGHGKSSTQQLVVHRNQVARA